MKVARPAIPVTHLARTALGKWHVAALFLAALFLLGNNLGCGGAVANETPGSISAAPVATLSPDPVSFGSVTVGATSSQPVTLSNTGNAALTISAVRTTGDFTQTNDCGSSLARGASCRITVTFTPTATGAANGTLSITNNASGSPQEVGLTGTGVGAVTPALSMSPGSLSFASQVVNTTSAAKTVQLTNSGGAALSLSGIATTGDYSQTSNCGSSLSAGSSCSVNVTFTPTQAGTRSGTLRITDNAADSPQQVNLTGTATTAPAVAVSVSPNSAAIKTGATHQFSATVTGTTNTAVTWSVVSGGGTISSSGLYTAPGSATTATIKATSVADTSKSATATVSVTLASTVAVSVSPTTAAINTGSTYQFSATVTGTTNTAVTWSVVSGGGTVSSTGRYTAPGSATTATIKATSVADPTKSATAVVTVNAIPTVTVSVSPSTTAISTGSTVQFSAEVAGSTAGVSWSIVSGGGTISYSGLYTAPSTATTATIKAVSNSDALASDTATVTVTVVSSGNAGCGATGTYPNLVPADQAACGNVSADGSPLSYESGYNASAATAVACGSRISSNGSYKLNGNLSCGAGSLAFQISPASGANNILINLNGYTVTGYIQVNEDNNHVAGGIHVFNGTVNCNTSSANGGACIFVSTSNGAAPPSAANVFHHLTIQNSADSSSGFTSDGSFSSPMSGAQATGGAYSDVYHHLTITVVGGTTVGNRAGGGGVAGTNRTVHYYNLKITNGDSGTNHYTEGVDCYNTYNCDVHNNYFSPNAFLSGDSPGRMVLLDGDAFGNGGCGTCFTQNGHVYNNYFNVKDTRALRQRSARNVSVHDNVIDNVQDTAPGMSYMGAAHWGDPTTGQGSTATYDYGNSLYQNNVFVFNGPVRDQGPIAFYGNMATGLAFKDNRIMCSGTGCSGIQRPGAAVDAFIIGKSGTRYFDVTACNFTYDSPLPYAPLLADGGGETQTSYLRNAAAQSCSSTGGAQCVAASACQ